MNQARDSGPTVQTAVRLPKAVFEALKASKEGVSGELRQRLDWTYAIEPIDGPTRNLLMTIARLAEEIGCETGAKWQHHAGSWEAFRQAILSNLERIKPEGSTEFGDRPHQSMPGEAPQEIGVWSEFEVWTQRDWSHEQRQAYRAAKEKSWQQIVKQRGEGNV